MEGKEPRMTQEEIREEMLAWQSRMEAEQQATAEALASANADAAATFFAENGAREGVTTTASGLQFEVLEAGDGASPTAEDQVTVHYRGTLLDGTQFDSSYDRGQPVTFGLGQVDVAAQRVATGPVGGGHLRVGVQSFLRQKVLAVGEGNDGFEGKAETFFVSGGAGGGGFHRRIQFLQGDFCQRLHQFCATGKVPVQGGPAHVGMFSHIAE